MKLSSTIQHWFRNWLRQGLKVQVSDTTMPGAGTTAGYQNMPFVGILRWTSASSALSLGSQLVFKVEVPGERRVVIAILTSANKTVEVLILPGYYKNYR